MIILIKISQVEEAMNLFLEIGHNEEKPQTSTAIIAQIPQNPQKEEEKEKKPEKRKTKKRGKSNTTKYLYNWNKIENRKYVNFLVKNRELFDFTQEQRKCVKLNVIMSEWIKTRNAAQCRSHHQKMMIKYSTLEDIIKANYDLISIEMVPKKYGDLIRELQSYRRAKEILKPARISSKPARLSSRPARISSQPVRVSSRSRVSLKPAPPVVEIVQQEPQRQNRKPLWLEYINDYSFHYSTPFNDEVSYFF